jgi:hypothetical protein
MYALSSAAGSGIACLTDLTGALYHYMDEDLTAFRGWVWLYIGMYSEVDGATCIISYHIISGISAMKRGQVESTMMDT